jgi:hypothetical protein
VRPEVVYFTDDAPHSLYAGQTIAAGKGARGCLV